MKLLPNVIQTNVLGNEIFTIVLPMRSSSSPNSISLSCFLSHSTIRVPFLFLHQTNVRAIGNDIVRIHNINVEILVIAMKIPQLIYQFAASKRNKAMGWEMGSNRWIIKIPI